MKKTPQKVAYLWQLIFFLYSPDCPKQPRTSYLFYKFFYPIISGCKDVPLDSKFLLGHCHSNWVTTWLENPTSDINKTTTTKPIQGPQITGLVKVSIFQFFIHIIVESIILFYLPIIHYILRWMIICLLFVAPNCLTTSNILNILPTWQQFV